MNSWRNCDVTRVEMIEKLDIKNFLNITSGGGRQNYPLRYSIDKILVVFESVGGASLRMRFFVYRLLVY